MKPFKHFLSVSAFGWVSAMAILLSSCGSSADNQLAMIPASSTMVVSMNMGQMSSKAISFSDVWDYLSKQTDEDEIFERMENSGIDFSGEVYSYFDAQAGLQLTTGMIIPLTDEEDFTRFLMEVSTDLGWSFIKSETSGISHASLNRGQALCLWNDQQALILGQSDFLSDNDQEELLEQGLEQFQNGARDQLASDSDEFSSLVKEEHDIAFFVNYEKIAPMAMMLNPMVAQSGIKDMKLAAGMDFEDGEILVSSRAYYDKAASRYLDLVGDEIDSDLGEGISASNPIGFFSMSLDVEHLYDLLDDNGLLEEIEDELREEGVDAKKAMEAFSGTFVGMLNQMDMKRPSYAAPDAAPSEPDPRVVVAVGLEDRDYVLSLLDQSVAKGDLIRTGNVFTSKSQEAYVIVEEDRLLIADPLSFNALDNDNLEDLPGAMEDMATDYPMAMLFDFGKLPTAMWEEVFEDLRPEIRSWAVAEFPLSSMSMTAEKPGNREAASNFVITTSKPGENSLRTIIEYVMTLAESENGGRRGRNI